MQFPAKRTRRLLLVALGVFVLVLGLNFPAKWLKPFLPRSLTCTELSGSLWSGSCTAMALRGRLVGDAAWALHALPLLAGRLAGALAIVQPRARVNADFELTFLGSLTARNVHAQLPLDPSLVPQLPPNLRGDARIELVQLRIVHGRITQLRGRIEAHDLAQLGASPLQLGSFEVRFDSPPQQNGDIGGVVRDLGGPFAFDGVLKLTPEPGYVLEGNIAARSGAPAELVRQLQFLGQPDAAGRRPISFAGTF
jgi:hypothetical protein